MIAVLTKTFEILELLSAADGKPLMLRQLVEQTGINQPTCARILQDLVKLGYASKFGPRHGYVIGPMAKALGDGEPWYKRWGRIAEPLITQLAIDLGEHAALAILHRNKRHVLTRHSANSVISVRGADAFEDDLYTTVTGRLLLAHADQSVLDVFIARYGLPGKAWDNIRSRKQLDQALEHIREHPDDAVIQIGPVLAIMALPVIRDGKVIAALGMAAPTSTFGPRQQKQALKRGRQTAGKLTEKLR